MNRMLALSLLLTGCLVGNGNDQSSSDILGGTTDTGDGAVGMLRAWSADLSYAGCTATLIAPHLALTAGHCAQAGITFDISFAQQPDPNALPGQGGYLVGQAIANPAYDPNNLATNGHDVAVVLLGGTAPVAPVALGSAPAAGATVRAVGYGMDTFGSDGTGAGIRRQVGVAVDAVAAHEIVTGVAGIGTCHGDSGGPLFDASGALVATDSYGDTADCHGEGHDMRVDDNLDFINQYLNAGSGSGTVINTSTCEIDDGAFDIKCTNGACTCKVNGSVVSTCTAADASTACNSGTNCCGF